MSDQERADIIAALNSLPEDARQFMLGYAAGRCASDRDESKDEEKADKDQATA